MKKYSYLLIWAVAIAGILLTSCKDDDTMSSGDPEITSVKKKILDKDDVTSAEFGDWLIVYGKNFVGIDSIMFNDVTVYEYYIENNLISLCVPRKLPNEDTQTLTLMKNGQGYSYNFTLEIPKFSIEGLYNEWADPGDTVTLIGENFDIYEIDTMATIIFTNNLSEEIPLKIIDVGQDYLTFEMPEENTDGGTFRLISNGENIQVDKKVPGRFRERLNIFVHHDDQKGSEVRSDGVGMKGYPKAIDGPYGVFKGSYTSYAYGDPADFFTVINGPFLPDMEANGRQHEWLLDGSTDDMYVKFEINVVKPWYANFFVIDIFGGYKYQYAPHSESSYITSDWNTVRIPLNEFKKEDGTRLTTIPPSEGENAYWNWYWRMVNFWGPVTVNDVFICWDNLRFAREPKED